MFGRQKFYQLYLRPEAKEPLETLELVPDNFNIWAMVFNGFWALYRGLWFLFLMIVVVIGAVTMLEMEGVITTITSEVIQFSFCIWLGYEANGFIGKKLERKGYVFMGVVAASNEETAEQRFLDKTLLQQPWGRAVN